jgi:hypothetical protein
MHVIMDTIFARCAALEEQLRNQTHDLEKFKQEADFARSQISIAEDDHRREGEVWADRLQGSDKEKELLEGDLFGSQAHAEDLGRKGKALREELQSKEKEVVRLSGLVEDYEHRILILEGDRDLNEPLVKIALEVRARYLEQAAGADTSTQKKKSYNQDIIKAGNKAAHSAIGEADRLLFRDGCLKQTDHEKLAKVYQNLYHCSYEEYGCMPRRCTSS